MEIQTVIVDDEPLSRDRLRFLLEGERDCHLVAECGNGDQAVKALREASPDLVFLDVAMPDMSGFEVLEEVGGRHPPEVIFVTALEDHALRAFEVHALDYLLKPISRERFGRAVRAARERLAPSTASGAAGEGGLHERLAVRDRGRIVLVDLEGIQWIDAAANYVRFNTPEGSLRMRETLGRLENRLDPGRFVRIHRSTIVHLAHVREIQPGADPGRRKADRPCISRTSARSSPCPTASSCSASPAASGWW